jgi:hypothetical protein
MNYRISALAVMGLAFTSLAAPAQAQGLLDLGRFIIGLPAEEKEPIEYRERAPLVVPPNQNLRPPSEASAARRNNPQWPQDPDVAARKKAAEEARIPRNFDSSLGNNVTPVTKRLSLDEIRAGRIPGAGVPNEPQLLTTEETPRNLYGGLRTLRQLDEKDAQTRDTSGNLARAEPRREYLTDPPAGTRSPSDKAAFRATREGSLGARETPSPYDLFRPQPNSR